MAKIKVECPITYTLSKINGAWKLLILWHLKENCLRFNELQKRLPKVSAKILSQQLKEMEADNLIKRKVYEIVPPKVEYNLTPKGKTLMPILDEMSKWGWERMPDKLKEKFINN